jgi:hypothetical protein
MPATLARYLEKNAVSAQPARRFVVEGIYLSIKSNWQNTPLGELGTACAQPNVRPIGQAIVQISFGTNVVFQCQACMATTRQQIAQKTQYSMPPITQIQLLVSL